MTTTDCIRPVRLDPEHIVGLSDRELERELTLATLSERRRLRFERLLSERRRRRLRRTG